MTTLMVPRSLDRSPRLVAQAEYAAIEAAVLSILGSTGLVTPMGEWGHDTLTAVTGVGDEQPVWTYVNGPLTSWDIPFDRDTDDPALWEGVVPVVSFNGTDEYANTPDAAYWTPSGAFSVGAWVNLASLTENATIMAKWNDAGASTQEWVFQVADAAHHQLLMYDNTNTARMGVRYDPGPDPDLNRWYFWVAIWNGTAGDGPTNMALYEDGEAQSESDFDTGSGWASMDDSATLPTIGAHLSDAGATRFELNGKLAGGPLGPFITFKELTADEVRTLYRIGLRALRLFP